MALPVILVNSATGSDSAASGAGPGTALTGSAASTSGDGLTVTLDGSPDLTNVATDGSHVIYLADATAGNRNFGKITAKDNGAKTVTVANAFGLSLSGLSWAIGGKRASIGASAASYKLWSNNVAAGDAMPGWTAELESGHAETINQSDGGTEFRFWRGGDSTDGPIMIRGVAGAATRPVLTLDYQLRDLAGAIVLRDFDLKRASPGPDNPLRGGFNLLSGLRVLTTGAGGSFVQGATESWRIKNCQFMGCGLVPARSAEIIGNYISGGSADGIDIDGELNCIIEGNIIADCAGLGIDLNQSRADPYGTVRVNRNTVWGCGGDGIELTTASGGWQFCCVDNNILAENGGYGIDTGTTDPSLRAYGVQLRNNAFYSNTSGKYNPSGLDTSKVSMDEVVLSADPFTNAASGDFSLNATAGGGAALRAAGFQGAFQGGLTTSYLDVGAVQHQSAGGGLRYPIHQGGGLV